MSLTKQAPPQPPPDFSGLTPTGLLKEVEGILGLSTALQNQLVATISKPMATFANVVRPLVDDANRTSCRVRILGTLMLAISPDTALREASRKAQKLILAAETDRLMRGNVAALVSSVYERSHDAHGNSSETGLDAEDRYLLKRIYNEYTQSGAAITDNSQRARLQTVQNELNEIRLAANKALTDASDGMWFSRPELSGLPLAALKSLAADDKKEANDRLWVPFRSTALVSILRDAERSQTRQKYHFALTRRFPENVDRLEKIVVLRQEAAELLGFRNHASLRMEEKMAESVGNVESLLQEIRSRTGQVAKKEIERLLQFKKRDTSRYDPSALTDLDDPSVLYSWDWIFYANKLRQEYYSIDAAKISEYFEVENTFKEMLVIFEELFGIKFVPIQTSVWHESVTAYAAWNSLEEGAGFLGYLYVDLFDRDGKNRKVMQHTAIQRASVDADGTEHFPCSALVLSFPRSEPDRPSLLLLGQITTMFHELGHAIHNLCSKTKYGITHSRDFVEVPSLMLEHWLWDADVLIAIGKHYTCLGMFQAREKEGDDTKISKLPQELAQAIVRTKNLHKAHEILGETQRALFDLAIHSPSNIEAAKEMNTTILWNKTRRDIVGLNTGDEPDESIGFEHASFGHIFRKYDASFFAYPLSKVYAADLYNSVFAHDPLNSSVARRYRYTVLQLGSSQSEMQTLENFLGRKPNAEAFLRQVASAWSESNSSNYSSRD